MPIINERSVKSKFFLLQRRGGGDVIFSFINRPVLLRGALATMQGQLVQRYKDENLTPYFGQ
jgi:hypothetical protein